MIEKNKGGRPTKYKEEYCQEIIEWFDKEPFEYLVINDKDTGQRVAALDRYGNPIKEPVRLPTLENFAKHLGVGTSTINDWKQTYAEFSAALTRAKEIQKDILVQNGLFGNYEKTFAKFVAVNVTDMKDKTEKDITTKGESIAPTVTQERISELAKKNVTK